MRPHRIENLRALAEGLPTFRAARDAVWAYLQSKGWKMSGPLKVPHATSPDGQVRLWFKAQAVWFSYGDSHNLGHARSVHSDIRTMSPEAFVTDAEKFARRTESLDSTTQGYLSAIQRRMGPLLASAGAPPWDGTVHEWLEWFQLDESLDEDSKSLFKDADRVQALAREAHARGDKAEYERLRKQQLELIAQGEKAKKREKTSRARAKEIKALTAVVNLRGAEMVGKNRQEADVGQLYMPGRETFSPTTEKKLTTKSRKALAAKATAQSKSDVTVPTHYQKECSMEAFQKNVRYFYKVKGTEWEGSKEEKLKRAIAASYSTLKRACGVTSDAKMTPKEIVAAGGG